MIMTSMSRNAQSVANYVAILFGICAVIAGGAFAFS
jgi:hypothetical protein